MFTMPRLARRTYCFSLVLLVSGVSKAAAPAASVPTPTPTHSSAKPTAALLAGQVKLLDGTASVTTAHGLTHAAAVGMALHEGDAVKTGKDSELHIVMDDGAYLAVRSDTHLRLTHHHMSGQIGDRAWFELLKGALRYVSGWIGKSNPQGFRLHTPTATIGIRGTDFEVQHHNDDHDAPSPEEVGTHHMLHDGATVFSTEMDNLALTPGAAAYVKRPHDRPMLHAVLPLFFRRRRGRFESLIEQHISTLKDTLLERLQERQLLNPNETLQDRIERFRQDNALPANINNPQIMQKIIQRAQEKREAGGLRGGGFGGRGGGAGRP